VQDLRLSESERAKIALTPPLILPGKLKTEMAKIFFLFMFTGS
jgi:hypothetical protein